MNISYLIKSIAVLIVTVFTAVSLVAQSNLPAAKQIIDQQYQAERLAGTQNPAPRSTNAPYPIVTNSAFETGIFSDCDSFHGMIVSNCWHGLVNGIETQVSAGVETEDIDPLQGIVALLQPSPSFIITPVRAGAVHIIAAQGPLLTLVSDTGPYVLTFDATTGKFTSVILDITPPVIQGMPAAGFTLWPPNKKMVTVAVVTATDSDSGVASFEVTGISSEPSDPNNPDIIITGSGIGPRTVQLRAERLGSGNGRTYTLTATAVDGAGNRGTVTTTCSVPHDQGP